MTEGSPSRQAALFLQLLLGLQQSGMMALGKLMNPLTRRLERNLDLARDTIDTLAALEARTRDNLEPDEARVLRQVLTELRMNYVDELKKSGGKAEGDPPASDSP
ncbi:MAG: DUF1844 domain-containing protein [Candidatus Eisenbacteria bacterium]|nr:DUF1844 domain-containing protein [Candidatus Eisenbacteria bacterium]